MPAPKKARKKATTPLGRSILQRERSRLAREQAKLGEQFTEQARYRMQATNRLHEKVTPESIAVNKGMVQRVAAVLASERVNVPITTVATPATFSAWTDFEKIHVAYHLHDDARLTAAILRGMLYHEGGHVRFTIPFMRLRTAAQAEHNDLGGGVFPEYRTAMGGNGGQAMQRAWNMLEDQRMETAVVSDSPRKAIYFVPMVMAELMFDADAAKENWPLLVWRKYLPKHLRDRARSYWITQHGTDKAIQVENVVNQYVTAESAIEMWLAVIEMTVLMERNGFTFKASSTHVAPSYSYKQPDTSNKLQIPIDPSMVDEETLEEMLQEAAKQAEAAAKAAEAAAQNADEDDTEADADEPDPDADWLPENPEVEYVLPMEAPSETTDKSSTGQSDTQVSPPAAQDDDDDDGYADPYDDEDDDGDFDPDGDDEPHTGASKPSKSGDQADKGETGEGDADSDADSDKADDSDSLTGGSTGSHEGDFDENDFDAFQRDLAESLEEAETERYEDKALDGDMDAYESAKWDTDSNLLPYNSGVEDDGVAIAVAENLAYEIEQTFQAATIDRAPAWVEQQRRGVVNVLRYETRQSGDAEFYRAYVDDDQPGYDIAVSVLLDYSGSMESKVTQLAQAGYACKRACDRLDIPCTVVLWDTDARTLWDAEEKADSLPRIVADGGTDPSTALADLDNQRMEKAKHIVLIFTDGSWDGSWGSGNKSLGVYKDDGRYFIGFVLEGIGTGEMLMRYGADEASGISDLMEIPRKLELALIENA